MGDKVKPIDNFVWVKRGDVWVKKYPTSWKGYKEPITRGKTTSARIQELSFKDGGYVYKDKHGKEV
tara:strand:- start:3075 stop:3272 length:198 start_codon:yes stop_codon:yes gene_type:complete